MRTFRAYISESDTSDRAKSQGLQYMRVARWGKNGVALYRQRHGQLIPVKKNVASTPHHVHNSDDLMYLKNTMHHSEFQEIHPKKDDCLYLQVVHSIAMDLGISPKEILNQYTPRTKGGVGLGEIIKGIQKNVLVDGKKLNLEVHKEDDIASALEAVKNGTPVICMVKTHGTIMNSKLKDDGSLDIVKHHSFPDDTYHALMLFGHDKKDGFALFRDSDHTYYKSVNPTHNTSGFLKVDYKYLEDNPSEISGFFRVSANTK